MNTITSNPLSLLQWQKMHCRRVFLLHSWVAGVHPQAMNYGDFIVDISAPRCSGSNFVKALPIYHRSIVHNLLSLSGESSVYDVNSWMEIKGWSAQLLAVWQQRMAQRIPALQVLIDNKIANTNCARTYSGKFYEYHILKEILFFYIHWFISLSLDFLCIQYVFFLKY